MSDWITQNFGSAPATLLGLSLVLVCGFLVTRLSKKLRLPNVSGYIIAGILIGPHALGLVGPQFVAATDFVGDIALGFIAFGVGRFFKKKALAGSGPGVIITVLFETLFAGVLTALAIRFLFDASWDFAVLLGAIATATAPASTAMTIRQYRAKGPFVNTLLQVIALGSVVSLLVFSVASTVVAAAHTGAVTPAAVLLPIAFNLGAIALGVGGALIMSLLMNERRSKDNRLILLVAILLALAGLCGIMNVSPLLCCLAVGAVYINKTGDTRLFKQLDNFTPPILSFFFVLSGMRLDLSALGVCGLLGIVYFAARIIGKYGGAFLGSAVVGAPRATRNLLGLALIPQAGVSIGLAMLGQRMLPQELGSLFATVVLSAAVLYELVGPACAKFALVRSGDIKKPGAAKSKKQKPGV